MRIYDIRSDIDSKRAGVVLSPHEKPPVLDGGVAVSVLIVVNKTFIRNSARVQSAQGLQPVTTRTCSTTREPTTWEDISIVITSLVSTILCQDIHLTGEPRTCRVLSTIVMLGEERNTTVGCSMEGGRFITSQKTGEVYIMILF